MTLTIDKNQFLRTAAVNEKDKMTKLLEENTEHICYLGISKYFSTKPRNNKPGSIKCKNFVN
jgi:hypothetical protein